MIIEYRITRLGIWPLTIVCDRYSGVYSGARYTAWNLEHEDVPGAISDGDNPCDAFWRSNNIVVGLGDTPSAAETDLIEKIQKRNAI